jgi:hypothetical protein
MTYKNIIDLLCNSADPVEINDPDFAELFAEMDIDDTSCYRVGNTWGSPLRILYTVEKEEPPYSKQVIEILACMANGRHISMRQIESIANRRFMEKYEKYRMKLQIQLSLTKDYDAVLQAFNITGEKPESVSWDY